MGIHYCNLNIKLNKVDKRVKAFNLDGREFVRFYIAQSNKVTDYENPRNNDQLEIPFECLKFDHCYMNLPMIAVEFTDVFRGLFKNANPRIWYKDPQDPKTI
jgi:tRNA (guanine37-N1)-methyltransferase